jgi:hypothetical protein
MVSAIDPVYECRRKQAVAPRSFRLCITIGDMRRIAAALMLAIVCVWLTAPAMPFDAERQMPACCRPGGKHHCALAAPPDNAQSGPGIHAAAERCPFAPFLASSSASGAVYLISAGVPIGPAPIRTTTRIAVDNFESRPFSSIHRDRGPPFLVS